MRMKGKYWCKARRGRGKETRKGGRQTEIGDKEKRRRGKETRRGEETRDAFHLCNCASSLLSTGSQTSLMFTNKIKAFTNVTSVTPLVEHEQQVALKHFTAEENAARWHKEKLAVGFLCQPSTKPQKEETEPVASDFCEGIPRRTQTEAASSSAVAERCASNERNNFFFVTLAQTDSHLVTISVTSWSVYLSVYLTCLCRHFSYLHQKNYEWIITHSCFSLFFFINWKPLILLRSECFSAH